MKKVLLLTALLASFLITVRPATGSSPVIAGEVSGVELCPEFACDAAIFTGNCDCLINKRQTIGFFWVSIKHEPLPDPDQSSEIVGGRWNLTTLRGKFSGRVREGTIVNNGDDTFNVTATLSLQKGGKGDLIVSGVLDHTEFPPTFEGELVQP
jgi:hypothetical protein